MIVSTTLQSKISKTKKRLSNDSWSLRVAATIAIAISVIGLYCFRATCLGSKYGVVRAEFPVLATGEAEAAENFDAEITEHTPTIVMTGESFFIGSMRAFSREFLESDNKIRVPHDHGAPQMTALTSAIEHWRFKEGDGSKSDLALLIPEANVPLPIVIQVMDLLKKNGSAKRIVLGVGLM
jgi:hypothetical protein